MDRVEAYFHRMHKLLALTKFLTTTFLLALKGTVLWCKRKKKAGVFGTEQEVKF